MADTFVMRKEWLDAIAGQSIEKQDQILADMFRYAAGVEMVHTNDPIVKMAVDFVKGRIDNSIEKYEESVERGKRGGRPKIDDDEVRELAAQGMSAAQIADAMGRSKETIRKKDAFKEGQKLYMMAKAQEVERLGF